MNLVSTIFQGSPYLASFLIVLATIVVARIVNWIFERVFRKAVGRTKTEFDDKLIEILRKPVFWTVLVIGVYIALLPLDISQEVIVPLRKLLLTTAIFVWSYAAVKISHILFTEFEQRVVPDGEEMLEDLLPFLDNLVKIVVWVVVLLTALSVWGINITPALASAGVIGISVAFAAKDTVANVFGGFSIFLDRPFKTGDYVVIKDLYRGEVTQIGIRSTKIKTRDNVLLTVPNAVMVTDTVVNETGFDPELRIRIPLGVAYGSDLEEVENVLVDVTAAHPEIVKKPSPRVRYRKFAPSAIQLEVLGVIGKPADRGRITHELIKTMNKRLRKEGIELPFPQRDIHLYAEK